MRFTQNDSIQKIMGNPVIAKSIGAFFPISLLALVPERLKNQSLAMVKQSVRTPWGLPFLAEEFVTAANIIIQLFEEHRYLLISLWTAEEMHEFPEAGCRDKNSAWILAPAIQDTHLNQKTFSAPRPAVIICPGGGYSELAMANEGIGLAKRMERAGYCPFVLSYRLLPNTYPAAWKDLALAVKYVRSNEARYFIDPNNLMLLGSSAGGHLCATFAGDSSGIDRVAMTELANENPILAEKYAQIPIHPNKLCLNYAPTNFMDAPMDGILADISGGKEDLREKLSAWRLVTPDYPKTFLWICRDDELVSVDNVLLMSEALEKQGVPYKKKIYPNGKHGCVAVEGIEAAEWFDEMLDFMGD